MLVERDGAPLLALPLVPLDPGAARIAAVPGSYWPFRSFPVAADVDQAVLAAALAVLGREARALRIGPVYARDRGIAAVDWSVGDSGYKRVIGAVEGPALLDWLLVRPGWAAMVGRLLSSAWRRSGQACR